MFIEDLIQFLLKWFKTRKWRSLVTLALVVSIAPAASLLLVGYGATLSIQELVGRYAVWLEEDEAENSSELQGEGQVAEVMEAPEQGTRVLLRRVLQLGHSTDRIIVAIAQQLLRQGRVSMAEQRLRSIAPAGEKGDPLAHELLANIAVSRNVATPESARVLLNDLEIAERNSTELSPTLVQVYAQLLFSSGKETESLRVLERHADQHPELNMLRAQLAKQVGDDDDLELALKDGRAQAENRLKSGEATIKDIARLVSFALVEEDLDGALAAAAKGMQATGYAPEMKAIYAELLCRKYEESGGGPGGGDVEHLENAFRLAPNNPRVIEQIAQAMSYGQSLKPELRQSLIERLADGTAPAVTHLIIGNSKLVGEQPSDALVHLERALQEMPGSVVVLNNLAYALINTDPKDPERAMQLAEKALRNPGMPNEVSASILDTKGQILLLKNDWLGATSTFERAIKLDPSKLNTRRRLAETYRKLGMGDMADVQLKRIEELGNQAN